MDYVLTSKDVTRNHSRVPPSENVHPYPLPEASGEAQKILKSSSSSGHRFKPG